MRRTLTAIALTLVALPVLAQELDVVRDVWLGDSLGVTSRIVAPSPDGRWVACALEDGVSVREVRTGAWVRWIPCRRVTGLAFSPDGRRLAISTQRALLALDVATWKTERSWEREGADAIAFVSTDRLACALGTQVRVVSVDHKKITWLPNEDEGRIHSLVAHPPTNVLAGIDSAGRVLVWDSSDGKFARAVSEKAGSARWSPDGSRLLVVTRLTETGADDPRFVPWGPWVGGGPLAVFDARDGSSVDLPVPLRGLLVQDATFLPDGRLVVLRAEREMKARLAVFDLATGIAGPTLFYRGVAELDRVVASPDGTWVLGDGDTVWSLDGLPGERLTAQTLDGESHAIAFAPGGELVVVGREDVSVWDPDTGRVVARHELGQRHAPNVLVLPSGRVAVVVDSWGFRPTLLDLTTGRVTPRRPVLKKEVVDACSGASRDDILIACFSDEILALRLGSDGEEEQEQVISAPGIVALAASDDLLVVATRSSKQESAALRLYDLPTCALIDSLPRASDPSVAAVSSDAHLVATGHIDGTIVVSDPAGEDLVRIEAHGNEVSALAFTADGAVLLSIAYGEAAIAAWDARTGRSLGRLTLDDGLPTSLAVAPTGRRFAVAISPGRVRVVELR